MNKRKIEDSYVVTFTYFVDDYKCRGDNWSNSEIKVLANHKLAELWIKQKIFENFESYIEEDYNNDLDEEPDQEDSDLDEDERCEMWKSIFKQDQDGVYVRKDVSIEQLSEFISKRSYGQPEFVSELYNFKAEKLRVIEEDELLQDLVNLEM